MAMRVESPSFLKCPPRAFSRSVVRPGWRLAVLGVVIGLLAGCRTAPQAKEEAPSRLRPTVEWKAEDWTKYICGPKKEVVYVKRETPQAEPSFKPSDTGIVYWVYDENFVLLGHYTDYGTAYKESPRGPKPLGSHTLEGCIVAIAGVQRPFEESRLERPRLDEPAPQPEPSPDGDS